MIANAVPVWELRKSQEIANAAEARKQRDYQLSCIIPPDGTSEYAKRVWRHGEEVARGHEAKASAWQQRLDEAKLRGLVLYGGDDLNFGQEFQSLIQGAQAAGRVKFERVVNDVEFAITTPVDVLKGR